MFLTHTTSPRVRAFLCILVIGVLSGISFITSTRVFAQTDAAPDLGAALSFAVLGGEEVTNAGITVITGDLGVSPGTSISGAPAVTGSTYTGTDQQAVDAQEDVTAAYGVLDSAPCDDDLTGQDLGGMTLVAGVYCFSSSAGLTGALTLDAEGNPDAVFVFQIGSAITTASASSVLVINGGNDCNVFFQVTSSATLGTGTSFRGNILALESITLTTGSSVSGRVLAQTGAVTLDTNTVSIEACSAVAPASLALTKDDGGVTVGRGDTITYTLSYENTGEIDLDNVVLTDAVPAGTTFESGDLDCSVDPCRLDLGTLDSGETGQATFVVRVDADTDRSEISNSATITSGAVSASATDTTGLTQDEGDGDDETGVTPVPSGTTSAPVATVAPPSGAAASAGASVSVGAQTAVSGVPDTGGGSPQATYWIREPRP